MDGGGKRFHKLTNDFLCHMQLQPQQQLQLHDAGRKKRKATKIIDHDLSFEIVILKEK